MHPTIVSSLLAASAAFVAASPALAAGIQLSPPQATVPLAAGTSSFELVMDFATGEATLGGGIDLDLRGPIGGASFAPSAWWQANVDPQLSGWGTLRADNDYEVHLGSFSGLSGRNVLGTLTVDLLGLGQAEIVLAPNTYWGGFYAVSGAAQSVTMTGMQLSIIPSVPEPASTALLALGACALLWRVRRPGTDPSRG